MLQYWSHLLIGYLKTINIWVDLFGCYRRRGDDIFGYCFCLKLSKKKVVLPSDCALQSVVQWKAPNIIPYTCLVFELQNLHHKQSENYIDGHVYLD